MKKRYYNPMKQFIAMVLVCAICVGLIPASLPETVHAATLSAAKQEKWYEVTAKINSFWGGHIAGEIILTNNSEETIQDWQIEFPWDARITSMWCGNYESTEKGYILTPADYNRDLAAGASVSIGFLAEGEDAVLEGLVAEGFFREQGVHITTAEERENMPPEPSREPAPTVEPTVCPTVELTETPILEPSAIPTAEPTTTATLLPTLEPTATATLLPTIEPTATPTLLPTIEPTATATLLPTIEPTATATLLPTLEPTAEPIEDFYVYTNTTLTEDLSCRNLFIMGGVLLVKGCSITVQNDFFQSGKRCILQDGTMDIRGNAYITSGNLVVRQQSSFRTEGKTEVTGDGVSVTDSEFMVQSDFVCNTVASNEFSDSNLQIAGNLITAKGQLCFKADSRADIGGDLRVSDTACFSMESQETEVKTAGDLVIDSRNCSTMLHGRLTLGGDLIQTENAAEVSLVSGRYFRLIFSSGECQRIRLAYPAAVTLGIMDFRESAGVEVPDEIHGKEIYGFEKIGRKEKLDLYLSDVSLIQDENILCKDVVWHGDRLSVNKYCLAVRGDMTVESGQLYFKLNGQMAIGGNLRISNTASLYLWQSELHVAGDLIIDSLKQSQLIGGSLILGGDLIQTENSIEDSLKAEDTFHLIFRSEKQQKISLAYPSAVTMGAMDFRGSAGVDVPDEIHGKEIYGFEKMGKKEKLDLYLSDVTLIQDETIPCNHVNWHGDYLYTNYHQLAVAGDLTLSLSYLSALYGSFEVQGNCLCNMDLGFYLEDARMQIAGDLTVEKGTVSIDSKEQISVGGNLRADNTGRFYMKGTTQLKTDGDVVINSQEQSKLSAGSLILGGDLIQTENSAENSLISDSFAWVFCSEKQQKIDLAYPSTKLGLMDFRKSAGVDIPDEIHGRNILGFEKIGRKEKQDFYLSDVFLRQDENILCETVNWYGETLYTYKYQLTVQGNINLSLNSFNLSEGDKFKVLGDCSCKMLGDFGFELFRSEMEIKGDLTIESGQLNFREGSRAAIDGDLRILGTAWLYAGDAIDLAEIRVDGDLIIDSQEQSTLKYGSLFLNGDLMQTEDSAENSLLVHSRFHLIMNGKEGQTISLQDAELVMGSLDLTDCGGLYYEGELYGEEVRGIQNISNSDEIVSHCRRNIVSGNGSIAGDLYMDGELSFEDGASLTLESDFYHDGALKMGGGTLKVKGDYSAESSVVNITDGTLEIEGDMNIKKDASLFSIRPKSRLNVRGDLNILSMQVTNNRMEDGVIEVGGDIYCSEYASTESFSLNGTKLVLNGDKLQTVFIYYDPDRLPYEIDMTESAGVTFRNSVISAKSIKGFDKIRNESIVIQDLQQNLEQDEIFHGDLLITGKSLNLAGHDFVVEGKLCLLDTILCPNEGFLETGGDYSMLGSSRLVMLHTADRLKIGGNFSTYSEIDHTNLLQRGRMGLYGNFYQYGNPYAFNSEKDLLVAFMGDYTHYYWFSDRFSSRFTVTYGKAEELDAPYEIDQNLSNAILYGIRAGLIEMADSPDEVLAAAAIGAAAGLGIALASTAAPGVAVFAGVVGIGFTIVEFYQDFKYICGIDGSYEQIRETAKLATVFAVTSLAAGIGAKVGGAAGSASSGKVHEVSAAVEKEIQNQKIWKSTCDWMKKNVLENAKAFTDDVKKLLDEAVVSRVKGWLDNSKALALYAYQNLQANDIYAKLKNLVDEDALNYLQKSFNQHRNLKLLNTVSEWIVSAQKMKGGKLKEYELIYIDNAVANGTARKIILDTIKGDVSSALTLPTLPKGSLPKGVYEDPGKHAGSKKTAIELQNKTADILADAGYDLEMLEPKDGGNGYGRIKGKNPDYLMMKDRVFDCYSPEKEKSSINICRDMRKKVKIQAERIVLNVSRISKEQLGGLKEMILNKTKGTGDLRELQELIVVFEDGSIETWFAR